MPLNTALAVLLSALLDRLFAEPPEMIHPVAWFGRLVAPFDRSWRRPVAVGLVAALCLPLLAAGVVATVVAASVRLHPFAGLLAAALGLFVSTSRRLLVATAVAVVSRTETDLVAAREELHALAGRDADALSAGEVRSAAVESAAENLADGLVAPLAGFVAGSLVAVAVGRPALALSLAAGGAAWVKAVNTLDSMLGYHSKPVGRASARLDDAVMWLPARASALLLALAAADPAALVRARPLAERPASPNSGWPMGTLAATLETRLEKPGRYVLDAGARLPTASVAERGVSLVGRAGWLAVGAAALLALPGVSA
jgi:adenosylcobinamide-phosphate synthase